MDVAYGQRSTNAGVWRYYQVADLQLKLDLACGLDWYNRSCLPTILKPSIQNGQSPTHLPMMSPKSNARNHKTHPEKRIIPAPMDLAETLTAFMLQLQQYPPSSELDLTDVVDVVPDGTVGPTLHDSVRTACSSVRTGLERHVGAGMIGSMGTVRDPRPETLDPRP
eukprot:3871891-Rhodomonas_salina.3